MSGFHCLSRVALIIFKSIYSTCINHTLIPFFKHADNMHRPCWWWYGPKVTTVERKIPKIWGVFMLTIIRLYNQRDIIKLAQLSKYQDSFRLSVDECSSVRSGWSQEKDPMLSSGISVSWWILLVYMIMRLSIWTYLAHWQWWNKAYMEFPSSTSMSPNSRRIINQRLSWELLLERYQVLSTIEFNQQELDSGCSSCWIIWQTLAIYKAWIDTSQHSG